MSEQKNQETRKWWLKLLLLLLELLVLFFVLNVYTGQRFMSRRTVRVAAKIITANSGQDVTLTCRAPNNNNNIVEWSRADLGDKYVLVYRDGHLLTDDQHPSFKNRVDLQDRQMKDGDVSLILKDVTINDTGTYECHIAQRKPNQERPSLEFISIIHLHVAPPGQTGGHKDGDKNITAESGQDVTLTCRAPNNNFIVVVWGRADLGDKHVFVYRDGQFSPDDQHPSFKNRVDLQDRQMKDGDVSLILKNVTVNDAGRYECRVGKKQPNQTNVDLKLINIITLKVDPPGSVGLIVGLSVPVVLLLLVAVVGFLIYRKKKLNPADPHEAEHLQLLQPECQKTITAESGQDVTLTCRAPNNNIIVVKWSRADLGDEYVLLYRDEQFDPEGQHPSIKNRVDLQDRQMKDGDVSLILKDVTINDTGTYECRVVQRVRGPLTLISIIYLHVDPPGQTGGQEKDEDNRDGGKEDKRKADGSVGMKVVLSVLVLLLVAFVGFFIYRSCKLNPADPHVAERLQPEYQKNIPAESGQDVTLTCRAPSSESEKMSQQLHQLDY